MSKNDLSMLQYVDFCFRKLRELFLLSGPPEADMFSELFMVLDKECYFYCGFPKICVEFTMNTTGLITQCN